MPYAITLADGRRVSVPAYVKAWRSVFALEPDVIVRGAPDADRYEAVPAAEARRQFRKGLHARINRHLPAHGRGRKWSPDWQRHALQTAHAVNTPRRIVRWCPPDLRARLAHRLYQPED